MLPNRSNDTGMPRIASDRKVMKTTEEGENRKGGRIGDDGLREEGGDTGKRQWNTKVKTEPRVTQIFINTTSVFPSYILRFIEIERREVTVKKDWKRKRRLSGGCDSDNTSSERLLNGVFFAE